MGRITDELRIKDKFLREHSGLDRESLFSFVLKHGRQFEHTPATFKVKRMTPKACYANAAKMALADPSLTYVEGYVESLIAIPHAWVMKPDGSILDPTIPRKDRAYALGEYFGVPFKTDFIRALALKTRYYGCVLDMFANPDLSALVNGEIPVEEFLAGTLELAA